MSIHVQTPDGKVLTWEEQQHRISQNKIDKDAFDFIMSGSPSSPPFTIKFGDPRSLYEQERCYYNNIDPYEETERGEE